MRARAVRLLELLLVAGLYFLAARMGLALASPTPQVSLVWPPTGIVLALLLLRGPHLWPAIFVGALLANALAEEPIATALGIACGNTSAGLLGWWLLRRFGLRTDLGRVRDVLLLTAWGAAVPSTVSASVGVLSLCLGGVQAWSAAPRLWGVWWLGDAMGVVLLTPFLLQWLVTRPVLPRARVAIEAVILVCAMAAVAEAVFASGFRALVPQPGLGYLVFPFAMWAALRFGPRGAATVVLLTAGFAIGHTASGEARELVLLQLFLAAFAVSTLLLAASWMERRTAEGRIAALHATARALAEAETMPSSPSIFAAVSSSLVWECGSLWTVDPRRGVLTCLDVWRRRGGADAFTERTRTLEFEPGVGLPGRVWASGTAAWVRDVTKDLNFPRAPVAAAVGLRTGFAVPVSVDGRVVGVLEFFSKASGQPDARLLDTMTFVGTQVGRVLERRQAREAVLRSEALKAAILESALDCIIGMDHDGRITEFNPAAERTFGWSKDEVLGREMAEVIVPPALREAHRAGLARYLSGAEPRMIGRRVQLPARRKDGSEFPAEIAIVRISLDGPPQFSASLRDVGDLLAANADLRRSNAELERFAAIASHDLQEPLRTITTYTQLFELRHGAGLDPEAREILGTVVSGAARMSALISGLLDYSRVGQSVCKVRMPCVEAVHEALANLAGSVAESGARIQVGPLPDVVADRRELVQVFQNLLANAIKFAGGRAPEIEVAGCVDGDCVHLRVSDNGIGIPAEMLEKAFLLFRRLHAAKGYPGTGLGLAICKKIVEGHGGRIWAESVVGSGSVVHFTLPED